MKRHLLHLYEDYKNGTLSVQSREIEQYSRKALTGKLALVLQQISSSSSPSGNKYNRE
jgi:ABC-type cobalamin/Fe3+-siderophores transport system ATPase subunit